jgi:hypothetical protein
MFSHTPFLFLPSIRLALGKNTCGITYMPLYTDPIKVTA